MAKKCIDPSSSSSSSSSSSLSSSPDNSDILADGYLLDGPFAGVQERKKRTSWSEEEHSSFLIGLEKLGKGRWTKIARQYVKSRTRVQVQSHAQNYFRRQRADDEKRPSKIQRFHWTKEEHGSFLVGLEKLGKGRWTKISRQYVKSRTPVQVRSHAQTYFRRQSAVDEENHPKLFDTVEGSETKQSRDNSESENTVSD